MKKLLFLFAITLLCACGGDDHVDDATELILSGKFRFEAKCDYPDIYRLVVSYGYINANNQNVLKEEEIVESPFVFEGIAAKYGEKGIPNCFMLVTLFTDDNEALRFNKGKMGTSLKLFIDGKLYKEAYGDKNDDDLVMITCIVEFKD